MRTLSYEFENHNGLQLIISANPMFEFQQLNQFELNMLKQNHLPNFLACEIEVIDNEYKFHYNVYTYKKLQHYMQVHCKNQLELYQFTVQLIDAIRSSYANMLTPDGCVIHMDTVFYDEQTNQILLTYLPVQHKDKILFTLLQWFLYWSNHVEITDSSHLHQITTCFLEQNFSLERIQETILEYLYKSGLGQSREDLPYLSPSATSSFQETIIPSHTSQSISQNISQATYQSTSNISQTSNTQTFHGSSQIKAISEQLSISDDEDSSVIVLDEHKPDRLRVILYLVLLLCIPLAVWLKLYLANPSMTNLLLSIGTSLLVVSAQIFIYTKMVLKFKQDHDDVDIDSLFADDTGEHHPPYHFTNGNIQLFEQIEKSRNEDVKGSRKNEIEKNIGKVIGKERLIEKEKVIGKEKLVEKEKFIDVEKITEKDKFTEKGRAKDNKQLDTVKLGAENLTVQLGQAKNANFYIVRHYNNQEQSYDIEAGECIVGRSIDGVHINDPYAGVSRLHIQFEYKNGLVIARDLGSRNGSYLNQTLLTPYKNYVVNEQDSIQLVDKNGPIYKVKWT